MPLVFEDLRRLARHHLADEAPAHTLQPTALVSEVYLRLVGVKVEGFENRRDFFRFASRLLRHILIDHARLRKAAKRSGGQRLEIDRPQGFVALQEADLDVAIAVHEALERLESEAPRRCRVVELRYFCGLSLPEISRALGLSLATVEREWTASRRWLAQKLGERRSEPAQGA